MDFLIFLFSVSACALLLVILIDLGRRLFHSDKFRMPSVSLSSLAPKAAKQLSERIEPAMTSVNNLTITSAERLGRTQPTLIYRERQL